LHIPKKSNIMQKLILLFSVIVVFSLLSCDDSNTSNTPSANVGIDSANFTQVQWTDTLIDFGTITKGQKVHIVFKCKNTGTKPMFIYYVRPGCGCTVAEYTKEAIAPGGSGEVDASYDSNHGIVGQIRKSITVQTNTTNPSPQLFFTGTVLDPSLARDTTAKKG
jgi:Protein of unknown function (DUF1573)